MGVNEDLLPQCVLAEPDFVDALHGHAGRVCTLNVALADIYFTAS